MKIGILGTGGVGQALGSGFVRLGHEVRMGSRDANSEKARTWVAKAGSGASAGTFADAARFAEVDVLATLGTGTERALELAGPDDFAGKVVIDATNPLDFSSGTPKLFVGHSDSLGEQVQRWLPKAKVVKAFNTVGRDHMVHPKFPGGAPDMFICGNAAEAKKTVTGFLTAFGWNTIDIGGIEGARILEPLGLLWVTYATRTNSRNHAFKLLRKENDLATDGSAENLK